MKVGGFVAGIILMIIGVIVYFSLQQSMSDCGSFIGQLGRTFSGNFAQQCQMVMMMQVGAIVIIVIGIGLLIYGATSSGESRQRGYYCKICGSESDSLDGIRYHMEQFHEKGVNSQNDDVKNLGIIKERLAKGEITKKEYDELKKEFEE